MTGGRPIVGEGVAVDFELSVGVGVCRRAAPSVVVVSPHGASTGAETATISVKRIVMPMRRLDLRSG